MKKGINSKTIGFIGSVLLLIGTIGGIIWLWNSAQPAAVSTALVDQKYQKVDISGLQSQAVALIANSQNAGNLPIIAPSADAVGRDNPFVGL